MYNKKEWVNGEIITKEALNNIENGIVDLDRRMEILESIDIQDFINVKDFGAKGDGISDDTTAIQKALKIALTEGYVNIYFPKGVYMINGRLAVYHNTYLKLDSDAVIRRIDEGGFLSNGEPKGDVQYGNIYIDGGIWDADNNHTQFAGCVHFSLGNADNFVIKNAKFLNNHGNHVLDIAGCHNVIIDNCQFLNLWRDPNGIRDYVEAVQLAPFNPLGQTDWAESSYNYRQCENIIVSNCIFGKSEDIKSNYESWATGIGNHGDQNPHGSVTKNIFIENCVFNECTYTGIRPFTWYNVFIRNCVFSKCERGIHITNVGKNQSSVVEMTWDRPSKNIQITNCMFFDTKQFGVWSSGSPDGARTDTLDICYGEDIIINDCVFDNSNIKGAEAVTNTTNAILICLCNNIKIKGCSFKNIRRGIYLQSSNNFIINDNTFDNINTEAVLTIYTDKVLIEELMNTNINISNNIINRVGLTALHIRQMKDFIIKNNIVKDASLSEPNSRYGIILYEKNIDGIVSNNIVKGENHYRDILISNECENIITTENICNNLHNYSFKHLFLGDSITYGIGADIIVNNDLQKQYSLCYPTLISNNYGLPSCNKGVSGMRYYHPENDELDINKHIESIDLSLFKSVSIMLGTNDWGNNTPLGENVNSNDPACMYGAINRLIAYIREQNPSIAITIFGPIYRSDKIVNGLGMTLSEFNEKLRDVVLYNHVKFVDMLNTSGIGPQNSDVLLADKLHPNTNGYRVLAARIYNELLL